MQTETAVMSGVANSRPVLTALNNFSALNGKK